MVIAGFDILFFGKKGFTTLAKAKRIKFRPKGDKSFPWIELDVSKLRRKADKQKLLFAALEKLRRELDKKKKQKVKLEEKEDKKRIKKLLSTKEVKLKDQIKFNLVKDDERIVRSKSGEVVPYRIYVYELKKLLKFVDGTKSPNTIQIHQYLSAVGEVWKKIFKKHRKTHYFLRITHRYRGLKSTPQNDPKKKKFDGFAIPRTLIENQKDIDAAIMVLSELYLPRFEKYLKFATQQTSFDFLGFVLEVST